MSVEPSTLVVGDRVELSGVQTVVHEVDHDRMWVVLRSSTVDDVPRLHTISFEECAVGLHVNPGHPVTSEDEVRARRQAEGLSAG